jgi:hypothetical protein
MSTDDHTKTSDVLAVSHASQNTTASAFDPDQEALVSTRHLDSIDRLPVVRASAKKYYNQSEEEPDFAIDTSALQRAFPEFSQVASSEDGDDDLSVEIGRGGRTTQPLDDSRDSVMSFEDSHRSLAPAGKGDRPAHNPAPTRSPLRNVPNRGAVTGGDSLRKDAQIRRASLAQKENKENIVPLDPMSKPGVMSGSRHINGTQRRTLSEIHTKVAETHDGSYISDERPASLTTATRNTRFGNTRTSAQAANIAQAVNKAAGGSYLKEANEIRRNAGGQKPLAIGTYTTNIFTDNATQQSFALPDVQNLSELISGVYQEGIPAISRQPRGRTTRFASPPTATACGSGPSDHIPLSAISIPSDEKAIFVSLKLLQGKVATLEAEKSDAEARFEDVRQENKQLKAEKGRWQKQENKRLSTCGRDEHDHCRGNGALAIENHSEYITLPEEDFLRSMCRIGSRKPSTSESLGYCQS